MGVAADQTDTGAQPPLDELTERLARSPPALPDNTPTLNGTLRRSDHDNRVIRSTTLRY